eukprot:TRINITY_DN6836_c0_g1_i1.p1 TRINITY_DN6836_c0_g1~~TRINITY_DN6836_c0_g1_i1.p1  ORF type:complete len:852 (-),score=190.87 TRINITY_DN6836_c0_g1_i1:153-2708(-)
MSLFKFLLPNIDDRKSTTSSHTKTHSGGSNENDSAFFSLSNTRVVIFQEGSSLLYDSRVDDGGGRPVTAQKGDHLLTEMLFGAVPLTLQGINTKVHFLPTMNQIVFSKVFTVNYKRNIPILEDEDEDLNSNNNNLNNITSIVKDLGNVVIEDYDPNSKARKQTMSVKSISTDDIAGHSSGSSGSNLGVGLNNKANSVPRPRVQSHSQPRMTRSTYALGVVFQIGKEKSSSETLIYHSCDRILLTFLTNYFPLIDTRIRRVLRVFRNSLTARSTSRYSVSVSAMTGKPSLLQDDPVMKYSVQALRTSIFTLFHCTRFSHPIWLNLSEHYTHGTHTNPQAITKKQLSIELLENIKRLSVMHEKGKTKQFLATIITAILSTNLSWAKTMSIEMEEATPSSFPNPVVTQLESIFGFITPHRHHMSRVIVLASLTPSSSMDDTIKRLILVCTYFIRCIGIRYFEQSLEEMRQASLEEDSYSNSLDASFSSINYPLCTPEVKPIWQNDETLDSKLANLITSIQNDPTLNDNNNNWSTYQNSQPSTPLSTSPPNSNTPYTNNSYNNTASNTGTNTPRLLTPPHSPSRAATPLPPSADKTKRVRTQPPLPFSSKLHLYGAITPSYVPDLVIHAPRIAPATLLPLLSEDMKLFMDHTPFAHPLESVSTVIADPIRMKCEIITLDRSFQSSSARAYGMASLSSITAAKPPQNGSSQPEGASHAHTTISSSIPMPPFALEGFPTETVECSPHIATTLDCVNELYSLGLPFESVVLYLEDRLRALVKQGKLLAEYITSHQLNSFLSFRYVANALGFDEQDMTLLASIAMGFFQPPIASSTKIITSNHKGGWAFQLIDTKNAPP